MNDLVKTTVRIPRPLLDAIDDIGRAIGVGRNSFICLAVAMAAFRYSSLNLKTLRRRQMVKIIKRTLQTLIEEVESKA